jgi:hypothetical protein
MKSWAVSNGKLIRGHTLGMDLSFNLSLRLLTGLHSLALAASELGLQHR